MQQTHKGIEKDVSHYPTVKEIKCTGRTDNEKTWPNTKVLDSYQRYRDTESNFLIPNVKELHALTAKES
jgi:hypothetical protein